MFRERELDLGAGTGAGVWILGLVLGSGTMAEIGDEDGVWGARAQLGTEPRGCKVSGLGIRRDSIRSRR